MDSTRAILHIDMDAFYASVEQLDDPTLLGKPVIVGGSPEGRGVVSAASYEARQFGVHSAMPMKEALRRCPQAVVRTVRMRRYVMVSQTIHTIFTEYTPLIEPLSLDEAFLDVTGSLRLFGSVEQIGRTIKQRIWAETGLVASVGAAPNKFLAKLASDLEKPDGFVVITAENCQPILDPLPIRRMWGVGKVAAPRLQSLGLQTFRDLRTADAATLQHAVGNQAEHFRRLACGLDDRPVQSSHEAKSISSERTFATDIDDMTELRSILLEETEHVAERLRAQGLVARTVTLKLRYGDFRTITRSRTLDRATDVTDVLWENASGILVEWQKRSFAPLRLLGFGVGGLRPTGSGQLDLFADPREVKQQRVDKVMDQVRKRYGAKGLHRET